MPAVRKKWLQWLQWASVGRREPLIHVVIPYVLGDRTSFGLTMLLLA